MADLPALVLASHNSGKAREFEALLGGALRLRLQSEFGLAAIAETGTTFAANALLKAQHAAAHTGLAALADDSGLEVDYLDGAPGVYSARYAGAAADDTANVARLLQALEGVPEPQRTARFRCVLVCVRAAGDTAPLYAEGVWEGRIALAPAGSGGFGYDPVFIDCASGLTAAQLPPEQKNARSHRARALAQLRPQLHAAGLC